MGLGVCPCKLLCNLPAGLSNQLKLSFLIGEMGEKKPLPYGAVVRPKHQSTWGVPGTECGPQSAIRTPWFSTPRLLSDHAVSPFRTLRSLHLPHQPQSSLRLLYTSPVRPVQVAFLFLQPAVPLLILPKPDACSKYSFGASRAPGLGCLLPVLLIIPRSPGPVLTLLFSMLGLSLGCLFQLDFSSSRTRTIHLPLCLNFQSPGRAEHAAPAAAQGSAGQPEADTICLLLSVDTDSRSLALGSLIFSGVWPGATPVLSPGPRVGQGTYRWGTQQTHLHLRGHCLIGDCPTRCSWPGRHSASVPSLSASAP